MSGSRRWVLSLIGFASVFVLGASESFAAEAVEWFSGWRLKGWITYPFEKFEASEIPQTQGAGFDVVRIVRGESECVGVVLRGESPLRDVRIDVVRAGTDLPLDGGLRVSVWRLGYVYVNEPSGERMKGMPFQTGRGEIPDILSESRENVMRVNRNLQFLVRIEASREALAGVRSVEIRVRFRREAWMPPDQPAERRLRFGISISGVALPEKSPLINTTYLSPGKFNLSELARDERDSVFRLFLDARQVPHPLLPAPKITIRGNRVEVDSTEWERAVDEILSINSAAEVFVPAWASYPDKRLQGLYFVHHRPAALTQKWFGIPICNEVGALSEAFKDAFGQYLAHIQSVIETRGWGKRFHLATVDEPYAVHTGDRAQDKPENNYRLVAELAALYRERAPSVRPFVTGEPLDGVAGLGKIGHWCVRNLSKVEQTREALKDSDSMLTVCDNYRTATDFPAVAPRTLGWLAWSVGARGWLTFEALSQFEDAYEGSVLTYPMIHGPSVWGMGQLFYPKIGRPGLVPTVRWEMMREGAEDYELLWSLAQRVAQGQDSRAWLDRATDVLGRESRRLAGGVGDLETTSDSRAANPQRQAEVQAVRMRVLDLLEEGGR